MQVIKKKVELDFEEAGRLFVEVNDYLGKRLTQHDWDQLPRLVKFLTEMDAALEEEED
jgi:hypothetical protein